MKATDNSRIESISTIVHLVRHGRIPDYQADRPLTAEGQQEALAIGRQLATQVRSGETIGFFASPTRRTRQTAELLSKGLSEMAPTVTVAPVIVDDRLQNLQFYLNGLGYDPIQPLFDVARWKLQEIPSRQYETSVSFQAKFWSAPDPMDYWLTHPSDAVETPEAVTARTHAYIAERLARAVESNTLRRDICVAHSANLRAFLRLVFGSDPGEPPFCGMVTVSAGRVHYQQQVGTLPDLEF